MNKNTQIATGELELGPAFDAHRMSGHAVQAEEGNSFFDVPLISHVEGGLWQGGAPDYGRVLDLPGEFDFVLSLYPWGKYLLPEGCERLEVKMFDSLDQPMEMVDELAGEVAQRLAAGQTVLVHCQAGLNRSGLIAARTLMLWKNITADEAIAKLRGARCDLVLCNRAFEEYLRSLDGDA